MIINGTQYRSVWWEHGRLRLIDQNKLPFEFAIVEYKEHQQAARAIAEMTVRGAPAIGAAGAYALALAAQNASDDKFRAQLRHARELLITARPTAVDLVNGVNFVYERTLKFIPDYAHARRVAVLAAAEFADRSVEDCRHIGLAGSEVVKPQARILTHCNAGALATVDWGTALAVIRTAHQQGKDIFVYVSETRPRLQGSRLTAFELEQEGIPHAVIADSAAGYYFWKKEIDLVLTGADRICLNGDIANKIGTYAKAVLAKEHKIPFYVAAPLSTFDLSCHRGFDIPIEVRDEDELKRCDGCPTANPGSPALNPAFDITPAGLITGIITPKGVFAPREAARKVQD
ncbi:MAG TPA: S-methyl-5-thioribose-1-phosphate isomerase [Candidatus Syntrophosphaera sp.]|nr:S-methyl-5-thioribose-1-phosphate isomerase [Candidatus Syntrophosphaera sp.]